MLFKRVLLEICQLKNWTKRQN